MSSTPTPDDELREQIVTILMPYLEELKRIGEAAVLKIPYESSNPNSMTLADAILSLIQKDRQQREESFDKLADDIVERHYQLRIEHNHADMHWYAYYAGREQRSLFDNDDDSDWLTQGKTPTEALKNLIGQLNGGKK